MNRKLCLLVLALSLTALCSAPTTAVAVVDVPKSQNDPDADFVIAAYNNVQNYFRDPSAVSHVQMLNAGLDGLAKELKAHDVDYVPEKITDHATWDEAKLQFTNEMILAKNLAKAIPKIRPHQLAFVATDAMLNSLDDTHTYFIPPPIFEDAPDFFLGNGKDSGIGIGIKKLDNDFYYFSRVIFGGPADKAGVKRLDRFVAIDGQPVKGELPEIIGKIRGKNGSIIEVTVERKGKAITFKIARDYIKEEFASGAILEENSHVYNYIALYEFNVNSAAYFYQAVALGEDKGAEGIILDLRGNPGGLLFVLEAILGSLLPKDTPLYIYHSRNGWQMRTSSGSGRIKTPLVVLIDDNSYSASEITAVALQEAKRAKIVGKKSGGAVGAGRVFALQYGALMMVTVAEIFTASGKPMEKTGVDPDVAVELTKEDIIQGEDSQLKAGMKELEKILEK